MGDRFNEIKRCQLPDSTQFFQKAIFQAPAAEDEVGGGGAHRDADLGMQVEIFSGRMRLRGN